MIINLSLQRDKGRIINATQAVGKSSVKYQPDREVTDITQLVYRDFEHGESIRNRAYTEFNDMSVITRMNRDQRAWNSYQEPESTDPDEQWKSRAVRPIIRNRIISIAAHVTGSLIFPQVNAQNDQDEEDRDAATVMRDLMEYVADKADYERMFLHSVIGALVNPVSIVHAEYRKVMRKIKEIQPDGSWVEKEVCDEDESGFCLSIVPTDELWIGNMYEHNIQKQPFLIWRRIFDYSTAYSKYGNNPIFKEYVKPGVQFLYCQDDDTFYEQYDAELESRLVEEVIYYNRTADLQLVFINGILITHPDQPNPRIDKRYPFAKTGYELIDEGRFFYYKSVAFKTAPDEALVNEMYRMLADSTFMQLMPPLTVFGADDINASVVIPGKVTGLDKEASISPINIGNNTIAGERMLDRVENSISESTNAPISSGQPVKGEQTAFEISRLEENARIILGLFGKMVGFLVKDLGQLMIGDILQHVTVGDVMEVTADSSMQKFSNFIIPDRMTNSRKKTRVIRMDATMPQEMSYADELDNSTKLMTEESKKNNEIELFRANPAMLRKMKFMVKVTPDIVTPPSENVKRALNLEEYDRAITSPLADQEALYRDLLLGSYSKTKDDPDRYIKKADPNQLEQVVGADQKKSNPFDTNSKLIKKEIV